jgi:endonuclease/exonuclease/phosphatase family metal-dependent hydrolase
LERLTPIAAGAPAILTGDFNSNEDSPAYQGLVKPAASGMLQWIDAYRAVCPERKEDEASFHGFSGRVKGSRIDFVFCTPHFKPTAASIDRSSRDGRYPSDHYPVTAVFMPGDRRSP